MLIAFVGSVFSPYYARAARAGGGEPENHAALNVALYGPRGRRWAMTERGRAALARDRDTIAIGPSRIAWDGGGLTIRVDEIALPLPRRIRGTVRILPDAIAGRGFALDDAGRHRWWPAAPAASVTVAFSEPDLSWRGTAYFDTNAGDRPLAADFRRWHWSRAGDGRRSTILYDVARRDGTACAIATRVGASGEHVALAPPPPAALPATRWWRIGRATRAPAGSGAHVLRTLEDTPFYARSLVETRLDGAAATAMHESLDLDRFAAGWVHALLPFRMPRRSGWAR